MALGANTSLSEIPIWLLLTVIFISFLMSTHPRSRSYILWVACGVWGWRYKLLFKFFSRIFALQRLLGWYIVYWCLMPWFSRTSIQACSIASNNSVLNASTLNGWPHKDPLPGVCRRTLGARSDICAALFPAADLFIWLALSMGSAVALTFFDQIIPLCLLTDFINHGTIYRYCLIYVDETQRSILLLTFFSTITLENPDSKLIRRL